LLPNERFIAIAGAIIACDLLIAGANRPMNTASLQNEPGFTHNSAEGSTELVGKLRNLTARTFPPSRFDTRPGVPFSWTSNAPLLGIPTSSGCDPLAPERVIEVRRSFSPGPRWGACFAVVDLASPTLDLIDDRFVLSLSPIASPHFELAAEIGGYKIYENKQAMPRAFLQPAVGSAQPQAWDPRSIRIASHTPVPAQLVITDTFYPGWTATVDGQPTPINVSNIAFRAVNAPAGDHIVEMTFHPRILYWSAGVTLLALLLECVVVARPLRRFLAPVATLILRS